MTGYALCAVPVPLCREFLYSFDAEKQHVDEGVRVKVPFAGREVTAYVVKILEDKPVDASYQVKGIIRVLDSEPVFGEDEWRLALWMERFYFSSRGEVLDVMIPGGKRDVVLSGLSSDEDVHSPSVELTDEQQNAVDAINSAERGLFYVYGITGSGKTEVFLRCAEKAVSDGGQVIYLVPEITLTHQLARQVLARFKDKVAILHSALTASQRIAQWKKIRRGEVSLVIGARSAVFAPCRNLKMIIIDEEHESSYKSGSNPRYHARQVAQKRASDCGALLVMGSATPSLEAWRLMDEGKIRRLNLTRRVGGGAMPRVTVANMALEKGIIGSELYGKMLRTLESGRQVILFLNRRGFSYYFRCRSCGYTLKCPNCDVSMTYHKRDDVMVCHYCGHSEPPLRVCPVCGSLDVMYAGFGTEQVEAEVGRLFPDYKTARLDADVASSSRNNVRLVLDAFRRGETQILLGTQMIAKGLNFPNVRLVGIVMADSSLMLPDFRADERTFSLLMQVSGRSGRSSGDGEVVIQTSQPDAPAIRMACEYDSASFYSRELAARRETGFPPFSRMVNILFRGENRDLVASDAERFSSALISLRDRGRGSVGCAQVSGDGVRGASGSAGESGGGVRETGGSTGDNTDVVRKSGRCGSGGRVQVSSDFVREAGRSIGDKEGGVRETGGCTGETSFEVFGAQECQIERINKNWRFHVLVRGKDITRIIAAVRAVCDAEKPSRGVFREVDVDPLDMV